jgi:hypothetical protein
MPRPRLHPFFLRNKIAFLSLGVIAFSFFTVSYLDSAKEANIAVLQTSNCSQITDPEEKLLCQKQNKLYVQQAPQVNNQLTAPAPKAAQTDVTDENLDTGATLNERLRNQNAPKTSPLPSPSPELLLDNEACGPNKYSCEFNEICAEAVAVGPGKYSCLPIPGTCDSNKECSDGQVCVRSQDQKSAYCQPLTNNSAGNPCENTGSFGTFSPQTAELYVNNGSKHGLDLPECEKIDGHTTGWMATSKTCVNGKWVGGDLVGPGQSYQSNHYGKVNNYCHQDVTCESLIPGTPNYQQLHDQLCGTSKNQSSEQTTAKTGLENLLNSLTAIFSGIF